MQQTKDKRKRYLEENKDWLKINKKEYDRIYRIINRERIYAKIAEYRKNHPDIIDAARDRYRLRKFGTSKADLTKEQWEFIKEIFRNRCAYCGKRQKRLTKDHIIPVSKGGAHTIENIVPACKSCNSKKNAGPPPIPVQPLLALI